MKSEKLFLAAQGILSAYAFMNYDAVGVSGNDLAAGYDFFSNQAPDDFPFVSANVYDSAGNHVFKPYVIKTFGSKKIAIIGLTGRTSADLDNLIVRDFHQPLEDTIASLLPQCDFFLVLSSLSGNENSNLLKNFPRVDVLLRSTSTSSNLPIQTVGQTLMAQSGSRGKYLGKLDIDWYSHSDWGESEPNKLETLKNRLKTIQWYIEEFSRNQQGEKIAKLQASKKLIEDQIAEFSTNAEITGRKLLNNYHSTAIPVVPSSNPEKIQKIVDQINDSLAHLR